MEGEKPSRKSRKTEGTFSALGELITGVLTGDCTCK